MTELPRLLLCCFDVVPAPTALSRRVTEYLKGLSDSFQVVALTAKTPDHSHIERYQGARLLRVPVGGGDLAAQAQAFDRAVRRQLESEEYLCVHFFDPIAGYALCERRAELGYRVVFDTCTFASTELPLLNPGLEGSRKFIARVRRQELFCLMNSDAVVVASGVTREHVASLGVDRERIHLLRAPVALEAYTPEVMGKPDATPMKIIHLGSQLPYQGLPTLLEGLQLALQTVDVRLIIVGPKHAEQARLEEQVRELKLAGKVEFQDSVRHDDIHKIIATADAGAVTLLDCERNHVIGSPLARLGEYFAGGRPAIAADLPVTREAVPPDAGVFYKPNDAKSLADAIVTLASDPARRTIMGEAARAAAVAFDGVVIRRSLLSLYEQVTGRSLAPPPQKDELEQPADASEATQAGRPLIEGDTQMGGRPPHLEDSSVGTQKAKTDPAIAGVGDPSLGAPAVMGVLVRDDLTPPGVPLTDVPGTDEQQRMATTEPAARRGEPPVVMGLPLPGSPLPPPGALPAITSPMDRQAVEEAVTDRELGEPSLPTTQEPFIAPPGPQLSFSAFPPDSSPALPPPPLSFQTQLPMPSGLPPPPGFQAAFQQQPPLAASPVLSTQFQPSLNSQPSPSASPPPAPSTGGLPPLSRSVPYAPPPSGLREPAHGPPVLQPVAPQTVFPAHRASPPSAPAPAPSSPPPGPPMLYPNVVYPSTGPGAPPVMAPMNPTSFVSLPPLSTSPALPLPAASSPSSSGLAPPPLPVSSSPSSSGLLPPPLPSASSPSGARLPAPPPLAAPGSAPSSAWSAGAAVGPPMLSPVGPPTSSQLATGPVTAPTAQSGPPMLAPVGERFLAPPMASSLSSPAYVPAPMSLGAFAHGLPERAGVLPPPVVTGVLTEEPGVVPLGAPDRATPIVPLGGDDEIQELDGSEVLDVPDDRDAHEADEMDAQAVSEGAPSMPPTALDPWFAQLVHGYCPPESPLFGRHTPPTTTPGKDT